MTYIGQSFRVFVYLWPIILIISFIPDWSMDPQMVHVKLFSKLDPITEAYAYVSMFNMGWDPSLATPKPFLPMCT